MKLRRNLLIVLLFSTLLSILLPAWVAQADTLTITVTTANDALDAAANCASVTEISLPGPDGLVSLREAICLANNNADPDTIEFDIDATADPDCHHTFGYCIIQPDSYLPILTDNETTIDGYTQTNAAPATDSTSAVIQIEIDGTGISDNGLSVSSSGNLIRGLAIYGFQGDGIWVANYEGRVANDNVIAGNYLGLDGRDSSCLGNGYSGVFIGMGAQNNLVGGDTPADRNLIACSSLAGIDIYGSGTTGNLASGNYIGTDPTGSLPRPNAAQGVRIYGGAQTNTIGGDTPGERNLISGNDEQGILLTGSGTNNNTISGNYIGTNVGGGGILPNMLGGITIRDGAQSNIIGGSNATPGGACTGACNLISGNQYDGIGIFLAETNNNLVSGNYIGPNVAGTFSLGNTSRGIIIGVGASYNLIGGDTPAERNLISGNGSDGIYVFVNSRSYAVLSPESVLVPAATQDNTISGNYIGTDANGTAAIPNDHSGVRIGGDSEGNTISENLISGNAERGVYIFSDNNLVIGNYIGTDAAGTAALGNGEAGVALVGAQNNQIGGDTPAERNLISGNALHGISLSGPSNTENIVSGNYIGTDATGTSSLYNIHGIVIQGGAHANIIGGDTLAERNVISGNGNYGIAIFDTETNDNLIQHNFIGTNASGTGDLGSGGMVGVIIIGGPQDNIIGPGNVIAYHNNTGVTISGADTTGNVVTQNSIYANDGVDIDLSSDGNNNMPAPTILSTSPGSVIIQGTALPDSTVEVFANPVNDSQGYLYLGSTVAGSAGSFTLTLGFAPYPYLTATATDAVDGTSEFSEVFINTVYVNFLPIIVR